jgi:hypothetical protein
MGDWMDIESAPRDGTRLFAVCGRHGHIGIVAFDGREWEFIDFHGARTGTGFYPTHYMELPPPPAIGENDE